MTLDIEIGKLTCEMKKLENYFLFFFCRAAQATKEGYFKSEIIPVTVKVTDKNGDEKTVTVKNILTCGN